ncbi:MAG: 3-methyl-2-oxobutanoate hydroxymethyltransferase [Alphaproteobacteria bacterium]
MTRRTIKDIKAFKGKDTPMVCLTAYTARVAALLDRHCDLLLVGDSMGMVIYGMDSTRGVTLDMMINHGRAVMRGAERACVVVDMPYGSYEGDADVALVNARRVVDETGCSAVKLEGGVEIAPSIKALVTAGIPVVGHVGLMPQAVTSPEGFRVKGRDADAAAQIIKDAKAVADAGAFAVVIEGVIETLAREITDAVGIPTIGIGASVACDGQILVTEDMLGITGERVPKFVKQYADFSHVAEDAVARYAAEVRGRTFPGDAQVYKPKA